MSPWMRRLAWTSLAAAASTGIVYFWMKYLLRGPDEFAVVHHPLQPLVLKLHILLSPALIFALGVLTTAHIRKHLGGGTRHGRRSGILTISLGIAMIVSGYAVQVMTGERSAAWTGFAHTGAGVLFTGLFLGHRWSTRSVRGKFLFAWLLVLPASAHGGTIHMERAWPVMGTIYVGSVWAPDSARADAALEAGRRAVFRVDSLMSTYRADSELTLVNRRAGAGQMTTLSRETADVLEAALLVGKESGGAFDVTVGPLVALWDFFRDHAGEDAAPPSRSEIDAALELVGAEKIRYEPETRAVELTRAGMQLDFGAIAKGYALDLARGASRDAGATAGLLDLGGQILCFGTPPDGRRWRIALRDPRHPELAAGVADIDSGSVSTSGDYERFTTWRGRRYATLFDPHTGWPVSGTAAVTVWAPTGMAADAWSTTLFILGADRGEPLLSRHPELGAAWFADPGEAELASADVRIGGRLEGCLTLTLP